MRLTTARYYTPSGRVIQENGIIPDIIVEMRQDTDVGKKEDQEEEPKEKTKLRRFLREKDLKKHLKGKSSIEGNDDETSDQVHETEKKELSEDLEKDNQLQQAVALLSGWEVMKKMFKNLKVIPSNPDSRVSMK